MEDSRNSCKKNSLNVSSTTFPFHSLAFTLTPRTLSHQSSGSKISGNMKSPHAKKGMEIEKQLEEMEAQTSSPVVHISFAFDMLTGCLTRDCFHTDTKETWEWMELFACVCVFLAWDENIKIFHFYAAAKDLFRLQCNILFPRARFSFRFLINAFSHSRLCFCFSLKNTRMTDTSLDGF